MFPRNWYSCDCISFWGISVRLISNHDVLLSRYFLIWNVRDHRDVRFAMRRRQTMLSRRDIGSCRSTPDVQVLDLLPRNLILISCKSTAPLDES